MAQPLEPTSSRADWLDVSKGIGILLVVLIHSIIPQINAVTTHLSSFTIPLFFVLAGLTYNSKRYRFRLKEFAVSRGRQFLIPYFGLYVIIIVLFFLLPNALDTTLTLEMLVYSLFYGSGPPGASTHLWFLPVLYFGMLLFAGLDRLFANVPRATRFSLLLLLPLLAVAIKSLFLPDLVPWHLGSILVSATFVLIGNEMRKIHSVNLWTTGSRIKDFVFIISSVAVLLIVSELNGFTDIAVDNLGINVWFYLVTGTVGTALVFVISSQITILTTSIRKSLVLLGNASQEIYEVHPFTFLLVPPLLVLFGWTTTDIDAAFDMFWPLRLFLGISISVMLVLFIIRKNRGLSLLFCGSYKRMKAKDPLPNLDGQS
ncbi:MAG: acyltransferase family protein [Candidatus Thorarchaeota archaeon]